LGNPANYDGSRKSEFGVKLAGYEIIDGNGKENWELKGEKWLRLDDDCAFHRGMNRAVVGIGPGLSEGERVGRSVCKRF
jgi:hypothetical protein